MAKRIHEQKRRKSCVQVATYSDESIFLHSDKFLVRIKSDCISKSGDAGRFGKPDSRMRINPNSFDEASASQVQLQDAYLGGLMEKQQGNPSHEEE